MNFLRPIRGLPQDIRGWWTCENHLGKDAFWDGGVSLYLPGESIPWSISLAKPTGMWDRSGRPLKVTEGLYAELPGVPLLGTLKAGQFSVYSCPPLDRFFPQLLPQRWRALYASQEVMYLTSDEDLNQELVVLGRLQTGSVFLRPHTKLPMHRADEFFWHYTDIASGRGYHEVWLRKPSAVYGDPESFFSVEL